MVETEIIEQESGGLFLLEVPEHALAQTAYRGVDHPTKLHGKIISREHDFVNLLKDLWFVVLYPSQFGRCKIARRIEQMRQALLMTYLPKSLFAVGHSP